MREQPVQVFDEFRRRRFRRKFGETDQVGEQYADLIETIGDDGFTVIQTIDDLAREDAQEKFFVPSPAD